MKFDLCLFFLGKIIEFIEFFDKFLIWLAETKKSSSPVFLE